MKVEREVWVDLRDHKSSLEVPMMVLSYRDTDGGVSLCTVPVDGEEFTIRLNREGAESLLEDLKNALDRGD